MSILATKTIEQIQSEQLGDGHSGGLPRVLRAAQKHVRARRRLSCMAFACVRGGVRLVAKPTGCSRRTSWSQKAIL